MEKDKLEVGLDYWLDEKQDESGTFIGIIDGELLFEPHDNCRYLRNKDGYINFIEDDDDFYLVSKNQIN